MQDGSSPFLLPCGNSRVNDKKVNEENSKKMKKEAQECAGRRNVSKHRPLLDTRLSRLLQKYKSFLKKISPKRRRIRTFGGTHKFAGDFLDKVPENRPRPLVSQQAQRSTGCGTQQIFHALGGTHMLLATAPTTPPGFGRWPRSSSLPLGGAVPEGDGEGAPAEKESLPLQPQAGVLR